MIGMSIEVEPSASHLTQNICKSGIKMCMFGNERADVSILKKLLAEEKELKEIKLEKGST